MKIALLGYGKMGKEIEAIAVSRGHDIVLKVDETNANQTGANEIARADVAIEFSTPHTVIENIKKCFSAKIPVVVGTTGWYNQFEEICAASRASGSGLFYATNFSLGVNIFFKVNNYLAELMNHFPDYNVSMEEIHHIHKLDKPSGTAITLAEQIISKIERKKNWTLSPNASDAELAIRDIREGEVPGTHSITYSSQVDDITIAHKAHNRKGFALGAVLAAEFMKGKNGIHTMEDLLSIG